MLVVCPFCLKAKEFQKDYLGLVNVPCDCGAIGVINRADSLHLMSVELAGIFQVNELSEEHLEMKEPVMVDMGSSEREENVPMMIQWARRKVLPA